MAECLKDMKEKSKKEFLVVQSNYKNDKKQILNSLDPNSGDGTLLNLDWSPVPIIPKFVKIVVNNILSRKPYPNIKAIDPLSQSEKDRKRSEKMFEVKNRELLSSRRLSASRAISKDCVANSIAWA